MITEVLEWIKENFTEEEKKNIDLALLLTRPDTFFQEVMKGKYIVDKGNKRALIVLGFLPLVSNEDLEKLIEYGGYFPWIIYILNIVPSVEFALTLAKSTYFAIAMDVVTNRNVIKAKKTEELATIVANAKGKGQAWYARIAACNSILLDSCASQKLTSIVASAKGEKQAKYCSEVAMFSNLYLNQKIKSMTIIANAIGDGQAEWCYNLIKYGILNRGNAYELLQMVANAKSIYHAKYSAYIAEDTSLEDNLALSLTKIIANAKDIWQAERVYKLSRIPNVLRSGQILELAQIIAQAKGISQALSSYKVAIDENVLASGKALELTSFVANIETNVNIQEHENINGEMMSDMGNSSYYRTEYSSMIAVDQLAISSGLAIELMQIVANTREEYQARYSSEVALNRHVLVSGYAIDLTKIIAKAVDENSAKLASWLVVQLVEMKYPNILFITQKVAQGKGHDVMLKYMDEKRGSLEELKTICQKNDVDAMVNFLEEKNYSEEKVVDILRRIRN